MPRVIITTLVTAVVAAVAAKSSSLNNLANQVPGLEFFFESGDIALGYFCGRPALTDNMAVVNKRTLETLLLRREHPCVSNCGKLEILYLENSPEHSADELAEICLQISLRWREFKNNGTLLGYTRTHPLSFTFGAIGGSTELFQILEKFNHIPFAYFLRMHGIFIAQELRTGEFVVIEMQAGQLVHAGIIVVDDDSLVFYKFSDCVVYNSILSVDLIRTLTDTAIRLLDHCQLTDLNPYMQLKWSNNGIPLAICIFCNEFNAMCDNVFCADCFLKRVSTKAAPSAKAAPSESSSSEAAIGLPTEPRKLHYSEICMVCSYLKDFINPNTVVNPKRSNPWKSTCAKCEDNTALMDEFYAHTHAEHLARLAAEDAKVAKAEVAKAEPTSSQCISCTDIKSSAAPLKDPVEDTLISTGAYCIDCSSHGFYTVSQQCDGCCSCCQYARDYHGSSIKVKTRQQHRLCNDCASGKCGNSEDYESHMIALFRK